MSLVDTDVGKILLLMYMSICSYQDFRTKHVDLRICFLFYSLMTLAYVYFVFNGYELNFWGIVWGLLPACCMFLISKITRSAIGMGDGYFFLGLGYGMGIVNVSEVLLYSFLCMALFSLILVVFFLLSNQSGRKKSIPMIPFTFLPALLVVIR